LKLESHAVADIEISNSLIQPMIRFAILHLFYAHFPQMYDYSYRIKTSYAVFTSLFTEWAKNTA